MLYIPADLLIPPILAQGTVDRKDFGEAKTLFEQGDRMRALRIYEQALKQASATASFPSIKAASELPCKCQ